MFGLFRKKKAPAQSAPETSSARAVAAEPVAGTPSVPQSLITWHAEIDQNRDAFAATVEQALRETDPLLASMGDDLSLLDGVWGPAARKLEGAKQSLRHAWNRATSALARDTAVSEQQERQADRTYETAESDLELLFEEGYRSAKAKAARALMEHALHVDARSRFCTGCAEPMVSLLIGQAQNVDCPACGQGQTVEPGQAFRVFATSAALWVGEWEAFAHWRDMTRAALQIAQYEDKKEVPLALLMDFHDFAQKCWGTTFGVEAQLVPQMASHIPRKVEARMKDANRLLREHWQWREFEDS